MFIIKHRYYFFAFSLILILVSIFSLATYGLNLGIDFKGGSILEVSYLNNRPAMPQIKAGLDTLNLGAYTLQPVGDKTISLRMKDLDQAGKENVEKALSLNGQAPIKENQFSSIGPSLGQELETKGLMAIAIVVILIIAFVAFAFRQVSYPVKSWKYGIAAIIALIHDIIISIGAMSLYAHFFGAEADALFLTALLTILGLSVNDTIVIFDRIRENLRLKVSNSFEEEVGISLSQTIIRSMNVTSTIVIVLVAMLLFGPASTKFFTAVLIVGMVSGAYSSIFVAAPILVEWEASQRRRALAKVKK